MTHVPFHCCCHVTISLEMFRDSSTTNDVKVKYNRKNLRRHNTSDKKSRFSGTNSIQWFTVKNKSEMFIKVLWPIPSPDFFVMLFLCLSLREIKLFSCVWFMVKRDKFVSNICLVPSKKEEERNKRKWTSQTSASWLNQQLDSSCFCLYWLILWLSNH